MTLVNLDAAKRAMLNLDQTFYNRRRILVSIANTESALHDQVKSGDIEKIVCTIGVSGKCNIIETEICCCDPQ